MIANICMAVVPTSTGMSVSFLYESAKDTLRWHRLSVQKHIGTVMSIGNMLFMDDKSYGEMRTKSSATKAFTGDDIDKMAQAIQRTKSGNDQNNG
ncbi:hypothetical protein PF327_10775 [Sulfurovum sp. XTW-4]|uniref:Uncharacterized protein n=1 Tax=Sulfurovum xiamenensis TaxID=3019066 RepID=A0ABT7QUC2_9BACT|nr:hypothetical protein [Sulfurovum xiamenensis]MDM5264678.1 hypothetical protein [Sulfurovum xiamenensis]